MIQARMTDFLADKGDFAACNEVLWAGSSVRFGSYPCRAVTLKKLYGRLKRNLKMCWKGKPER